MKILIYIIFVLFSISAVSQNHLQLNIPSATLTELPVNPIAGVELIIDFNLLDSSALLPINLEFKNSTEHTIHAPKRALTLDEFELEYKKLYGPKPTAIENSSNNSAQTQLIINQ